MSLTPEITNELQRTRPQMKPLIDAYALSTDVEKSENFFKI